MKNTTRSDSRDCLFLSDVVLVLLNTMQNTTNYEAIESIIEAELQELRRLELRV